MVVPLRINNAEDDSLLAYRALI